MVLFQLHYKLLLLYWGAYLTNDKLDVIVESLSEFDRLKGGGASPVSSALRALLLWGSVHCLPTTEPRGQVGASHPYIIPHMEIPKEGKKGVEGTQCFKIFKSISETEACTIRTVLYV